MPEQHDAEAIDRQAQERLQLVSRAAGIELERLVVLNESETTFPVLAERVRLYKVADAAGERSVGIAMDEQGQTVDAEDVVRREQEAARSRYGNLQPALHQVLIERGDDRDDSIPVLLRYAVAEEAVDLDKTEVDAATLDEGGVQRLGTRARQVTDEVSQRAAALHLEVFGSYGISVEEESRPSGPFVRAQVPLRALSDLSRDERIAFIGLDREQPIPDYPTIPDSLPTTRADSVHSAGARGAGVRIAVLESGTTNVSTACFNIGATQDISVAANDHMTKSVGIIGNRYSGGGCSGVWQGYAPDATVLLANDPDYKDAYDWARGESVNVVTMSWHFGSEETNGGLHSRDIYFDYWVTRWPYPSVFTSAGNEAASDAYASGKGYNFFGVGNVLNDGDGNRCNDAISDSSSSKDPTSPHGDREVPQIAAPGSRHELLGSSFGGTSCATPVAASIAALLMSHNPSLKIWPEAIRAIMLATANYQGADGADYSLTSDGADGVGMLNAQYGMWTAGRRETGTTSQFRAHDYGSMSASSFSGGFFTKSWKAQTYTTSSRIRVALTWNSKVTASSSGAPISSVLDADLDLWIYDPDGNLVVFGSSWDSSFEFVEFSPTKLGEYTIKVRGFSVPADFFSWYGIAWTTHYELC
jgi:Subtilase family